jgi:predicted DNA-binding protein (MmcQ/YjbR family)
MADISELTAATRQLREICLELPETTETLTFSHPTWQAGRKTFCVLDRYQGVDCVCFKTTLDKQKALLARDGFFAAPYGGKMGWTCARIDAELDWEELEELIIGSWRLYANRRMLEKFDLGDD